MTVASTVAALTAHALSFDSICRMSYVPPIRPDHRGRWIVVFAKDGEVRGFRCRKLSRARRVARETNGFVMHYRAREWGKPQPAPSPWIQDWADTPDAAVIKAALP